MKIRTLGLLTLGLLATLAPSAKANFITNGGFTSPTPAGAFATYQLGSTAITGWTVISGTNNPGQGSVDLLTSAFIAPPVAGQQTVDLDGTGATPAGGLSTTSNAPLTIGQTYNLTFAYTNNPNGASAAAQVSIADTVGGTVLYSSPIAHAGATFSVPGYTVASIFFVADTTSVTISFASNDPAVDPNGIVLGNVALNAVPEPASCAMLGLGVLAVGAYARRRKA